MLPSERSSLSSGGDLRSLRGETFAPFGGRPLLPSRETLAAKGKTLNPITETFAPLGGDLCSPRGDLCSLRGRPLLPSGGGLCSPGRSVEAGMGVLPHSCRVIRPRAPRVPFGDRIGVLVLGSREMRCLCIRMRFPHTSPGRSVEAGMVCLPHSCRVIRLRALPGCNLEPGWASECSEAGKCGARA